MSKSELKRLNVQAGVAIDQPQWVCLLCGNKHDVDMTRQVFKRLTFADKSAYPLKRAA